uniref:Uncharacterized protein n=1 Tax=Cyanothece sp. (strain PCC 7425 / ATCC 29141) TaxID=395961 RepID=B8HKX5_CYAP4
MSPMSHPLYQQLTRLLILPLAALLLISGLIAKDIASANPLSGAAARTENPVVDSRKAQPVNKSQPDLQPEVIAQPVQSATEQISSALQQLIQEAQLSFEQAIQDTQQAIRDLPQTLESASANPAQFQRGLESRKDLLDDIADSIDGLGERINKLGGNFSQTNAKAVKSVFDDAADAIEVLADDIEDAAKGSSAVLRVQINAHIQSVNQSLEQAKQTLQSLSLQPT